MARDLGAEFPKNWQLEINGVACNIYFGENGGEGFGITESTGQGGPQATVWFQCVWDDRWDLIAGLVGKVDYLGNTVVRDDPYSYPFSAHDFGQGILGDRLFCTSVSVKGTHPWRDDTGDNVGLAGWVGYTYAIIQAEFTAPPYLIKPIGGVAFNDLSGGTYTYSDVQVSGEVFSPPGGAFIFATGAHANQPLLDIGASQIRTRAEIKITRVRMPIVPFLTSGPLNGTVNDIAVTVGGQNYPMGSMLYNGMRAVSRSDPYNGGIVWDIDFCWLANSPANTGGTQLDWNYFLDPDGNWNKVTTSVAAGSNPVFAYQDHTVLFNNAIT